jgi:hypothetical protein
MKFSNLTRSQRNAMNHVAFHGFATTVKPKLDTLRFLAKAGLIERVPSLPEWPNGYQMAIPVHAAWCMGVDLEFPAGNEVADDD